MAIKTSSALLENLDTGEVETLEIFEPETAEDLAAFFGMTMEDLADLQERADAEGWN